MPKLKVGLVVDDGLDKPDGVQQYVLTIGAWLSQQGHEVHYLAGETQRRDIPNLHSLSHNIKVRFNGNRLSMPLPTSRSRIRRFIRREGFDVLHVQTPHSPFMAQPVILAAESETAVIGTFHILPYHWLSAIGNRALGVWLRPSLKRFDKIVSVSPAAAAFAKKSFGIDTAVLPNVIDYNRFNAAKPLPQYADSRLTVLFLGRLVERKGCMTLLQAVALLKQRPGVPSFRVVICGRGPLEGKLISFVEQHGLADIVELVGFVSETDKPRYYASADIAVFPSRGGESFGIVLIEAMASGHAVVLAGDNPGYRSVMSEQAGLLFPPQDAEKLADTLEHYLDDRAARQRVQRWAADYAEQFDVAVVGRTLLTMYTDALRKRRQA